MQRFWNSRTAAVACLLGLLLSTTLQADGGIRVHRANQYAKPGDGNDSHHHSAGYYHDWKRLQSLQHKHKQGYHDGSRQPPLPDSRFPNSYSEYSNYQKRQSQQHRDR